MAQHSPNTELEAKESLKSSYAISAKSVMEIKSTRPDHASCRKSSALKFRSGWRTGVLLSCAVAFTVLLINVAVLIWTLSNSSREGGIGTLYKGNCARTKSLNTWLQFFINILSTALLGASNYCMQCLTAPTRQEVDKAHRQKHLLRIGVPSMRNLKAISRNHVVLWVGLALSSLPLHFLLVPVSVVTNRTDIL